jgi:sec-independent protein translocase protein TatC
MKRKEMPFLEHLTELRGRIIRILVALVLASAAGFFFAPAMLKLLQAPYGGPLIVIAPTESFSIYMRVALIAGAIVSLPYSIWEIWGFMAPALHPRERRYAFAVIPFALILFLSGAAFAWFVMIPVAIGFLSGFLPELFKTEWTSQRYYPFILSLLFWVGACFELPLVVFVLAKLRFVSARLLLRGWRIAMVGILVAAAVITPTTDAFNMMLVVLPLVVLYLLSVLLAALAQRRDKRA